MDSKGRYTKKGNLDGTRHGDAYQVHVLMLLSERAGSDGYERYKDFWLATEMDDAGVFDDAVLQWPKQGNTVAAKSEFNWLFVQVKHMLKPFDLEEKNLFPEKFKGDFFIYKYFESFWNIKHSGKFIGNKQFVIFTNCGLHNHVQDWFADAGNEIECILRSETNREQFMKFIPTDKLCEKLLEFKNLDFNKITEIVRSTLIEPQPGIDMELIKIYRAAINRNILVTDKGSIVRFAPRFIKKKNLLHAEHVLRGKLFKEDATLEQLESYRVKNTALYDILTSKAKTSSTLPTFVEKAEVEEFFNSFIFAINQPDNNDMDMAIAEDLKMSRKGPVRGPTDADDYALLASCKLKRRIYDCLDENVGQAIGGSDVKKILLDAQKTMESPVMYFPTILFREQMLNLRVKFKDTIPTLPESNSTAIVTSHSLLTSLKVFQKIPAESYYYFTLNNLQNEFIRNKLCETLRDQKTSFYLLLKDDGSKFEFASEIVGAVASGNSVKLILLTDGEESASRFFNEHTYTLVKEEVITLDQLTEQEILRNKTVLFQGIEGKLSDLADHEVLGQIVKNDTLEKLLRDEIVTIGPTLPEPIEPYISRTITTTRNTWGGIFAHSNVKTYKEEQFLDNLDNLPALAAEQQKSNAIITSPTPGGEPFNVEQLVDNQQPVGSPVVVLSSKAGMGKTTLWKKIAFLTKSRFVTEWVFYLNLYECGKHFKNSINLDVAEFLIEHFKLPLLDASLLRDKLDNHKRVYVFCDGFDELPFEYMQSAIEMFRRLQKMTQVLVNTRALLLEKLKEALDTIAFSLTSIHINDQLSLFYRLCNVKEEDIDNDLKNFVHNLFKNILAESLHTVSDFVGVPMMITMLAEIYRPDIEQYKNTRNPEKLKTDSDNLDITQLYEKYVYSFFRRHTNLSIANRSTQLMFHADNYIYKGFVKLHCYLGLKNVANSEKIHQIIRNTQKLQERERQYELLDSPIVVDASAQSTKPIFIHLSIAEFFAAKCLILPLKKGSVINDRNIKIYYEILRDYPIVRVFFFCFACYHKSDKDFLDKLELFLLEMGRPTEVLLWVFSGNLEELAERFLKKPFQNVDVNAEGINNETVLHMGASKGWFEVVKILIDQGASIDAKDRYNHTPLHYAAISGHLAIVELLVNAGCDLNTLGFNNYNALHFAALNRHTLVVQFLMERGVKVLHGFFMFGIQNNDFEDAITRSPLLKYMFDRLSEERLKFERNQSGDGEGPSTSVSKLSDQGVNLVGRTVLGTLQNPEQITKFIFEFMHTSTPETEKITELMLDVLPMYRKRIL